MLLGPIVGLWPSSQRNRVASTTPCLLARRMGTTLMPPGKFPTYLVGLTASALSLLTQTRLVHTHLAIRKFNRAKLGVFRSTPPLASKADLFYWVIYDSLALDDESFGIIETSLSQRFNFQLLIEQPL